VRICVNSRDLTEIQKRRIEDYFLDNFSFASHRPTLVWTHHSSEAVLLGYPYGPHLADERAEDYSSIMFRVHEGELMMIAGRGFCAPVMRRTA
jgi:hypothetical protein